MRNEGVVIRHNTGWTFVLLVYLVLIDIACIFLSEALRTSRAIWPLKRQTRTFLSFVGFSSCEVWLASDPRHPRR